MMSEMKQILSAILTAALLLTAERAARAACDPAVRLVGPAALRADLWAAL